MALLEGWDWPVAVQMISARLKQLSMEQPEYRSPHNAPTPVKSQTPLTVMVPDSTPQLVKVGLTPRRSGRPWPARPHAEPNARVSDIDRGAQVFDEQIYQRRLAADDPEKASLGVGGLCRDRPDGRRRCNRVGNVKAVAVERALMRPGAGFFSTVLA